MSVPGSVALDGRTAREPFPKRSPFIYNPGAIPGVLELLQVVDVSAIARMGLGTAVDVTAVAQMGPGGTPETAPSGPSSVLGSALGAFLTTLIVGAVLLAVVPEYTRKRMDAVLERPLNSFLYGVVCLLALVVAIVVLFFTVIGIIVAIPLAILAYLVWAVGASIAFLAIGDRLVGHGDGWTKPLLVGAAINGGLTLTGIGGIITFAVGAAGFGTVLRAYLE